MKHNKQTLASWVLQACSQLLPDASLPVCALILVCWPPFSSGHCIVPHPKCLRAGLVLSYLLAMFYFFVFVAYLLLSHHFSREMLPFSERAEPGRLIGTVDCLQKNGRSNQRSQSRALKIERPQEAPWSSPLPHVGG